MKFYNIGSLNLDYTYFVDEFLKPGETKSSLGLQISCGGKGFNQSIALARAGASVFHGGCIGAEGDRFLERFKREQIDTEFIQQTTEKNGHAVTQVNGEGENCILLHGGTNQKVSKKLIDRMLSSVEKQDMIVLQNEICHLEYILEEAQRKGIKAALNAAPVSEEIKAHLLNILFPQLRQNMRNVIRKHTVGRQHQHVGGTQRFSVMVQQICDPVERDGSLSASGRSLDHKDPVAGIPDNRILFPLNRAHNIFQLYISIAAELLLQNLVVDLHITLKFIDHLSAADLVLPL